MGDRQQKDNIKGMAKSQHALEKDNKRTNRMQPRNITEKKKIIAQPTN